MKPSMATPTQDLKVLGRVVRTTEIAVMDIESEVRARAAVAAAIAAVGIGAEGNRAVIGHAGTASRSSTDAARRRAISLRVIPCDRSISNRNPK